MGNDVPADNRKRSEPDTWVDRYGDYLYGYALSSVRDPATAEELVQETFLGGLRALKNFKRRASERTWLTGILKHKIADYYRKKNRELPVGDIESTVESTEGFFDDNERWKVGPAKWTANPMASLEQKEFWEVFHRCLTELSGRLADTFTLREINGLGTKEICKVLNISTTNCWVILYRARMLLRRCLEVNWFGVKAKEDT
ncbi:MAG: sigma-70 family RNA polymerase sigma factor [Deltaproteobacteria bacterium]|nr:sigma-70 family RNA polymerase sigma factor [Deltaproteobacteria bacterium]